MDVAVIGGADGPTAIFVASSINWGWVAAGVALAVAVVLFFVLRKRKK
ncbi:MAG: LPXTG cell wall anchor domain-containing protein [Clostridia bacterium]|nr:LPXTG cell wall anchor domain-containing protein [Clostridia bacterium]